MRTQNVLQQSKKLPEAFTQKSTNSSNIPPSVWQIVTCCKKKNRSGAPNAREQAPGMSGRQFHSPLVEKQKTENTREKNKQRVTTYRHTPSHPDFPACFLIPSSSSLRGSRLFNRMTELRPQLLLLLLLPVLQRTTERVTKKP